MRPPDIMSNHATKKGGVTRILDAAAAGLVLRTKVDMISKDSGNDGLAPATMTATSTNDQSQTII